VIEDELRLHLVHVVAEHDPHRRLVEAADRIGAALAGSLDGGAGQVAQLGGEAVDRGPAFGRHHARDVDEMRHPVGRDAGDLRDREAAHRVADEHHPVMAGGVDVGERRRGEVPHRQGAEVRVAGVAIRSPAHRLGWEVDREHRPVEERERRLPAPRTVRAAVDEDEWRGLAHVTFSPSSMSVIA
jgi:hypothetical protein